MQLVINFKNIKAKKQEGEITSNTFKRNSRRLKMKQLKHLSLIVALLCFVASSAIISNAAQPGASPRIGENISVAPSTSVATPLQQPLTVNLSGSNFLCGDLLQKMNSIAQLVSDISVISNNPYFESNMPGITQIISSDVHYYKGHLEGCCSQQKSFSVQDQQAAGCANSDTVQQCMDKLLRQCINHGRNNNIMARLTESQEKSNNISIKTKQLSEQIKNLLSIMP